MEYNRASMNKIKVLAAVLSLFVFFAGCSVDSFFVTDLKLPKTAFDLSKDFEWYQSQMNTGPYSGSNCGPSVVAMTAEYFLEREVSVQEVRNSNHDAGGWWYMNDITKALDHYQLTYTKKPLLFKEQLLVSLSRGHLVIICLNMVILTRAQQNTESRFNRFYDNVSGHFIIIKGYSADAQWLNVYDPNNWAGDYYSDGTSKGKDRKYNINEVFNAAKSWNPAYIEL